MVLAVKILARLLVQHGSGYSKKFAEKNGGYTVLKHHLQRWWNIPAMWSICFAILLGQDIAHLDLKKPFNASELLATFVPGGYLRITHPEMLPVIMAMLRSGLRSTVLGDDPALPSLTDDAFDPEPAIMLTGMSPGMAFYTKICY